MSGAGLFVIGVLVTLIVAAASALLIYAAVLDGRDAARRRAADREPAPRRNPASRWETARATGDFGTPVRLLDRAGLSEVPENEGSYTVFVPCDGAFSRLPQGVVDSPLAAPDTPADVLRYHLVPGRLRAAVVAARMSAGTLQGEDLAISNNRALRIDGACLISGDIEASKGVIQVIDRVLLPARI